MTGPLTTEALMGELARIVRAAVRHETTALHAAAASQLEPPPVAALWAERAIVVALLDGAATLEDLAGLEPGAFTTDAWGYSYALLRDGLARGRSYTTSELAAALARAHLGREQRIAQALEQAVACTPVLACEPRVLVEHLRAVHGLRELFERLRAVEAKARSAAQRGLLAPADVWAELEAAVAGEEVPRG